MRMFVALELPDGLKAEIADLSRTLSRGCGDASWITRAIT